MTPFQVILRLKHEISIFYLKIYLISFWFLLSFRFAVQTIKNCNRIQHLEKNDDIFFMETQIEVQRVPLLIRYFLKKEVRSK